MSAETPQPIFLPFPPEPVLSVDERAELSKLFADPAFWDWFAAQPEPSDEELAAIMDRCT
jgi:succinate dehydrogenase flavin-adding protein (antitoxin of CptAB toxin-antitoxin module)